MDLLSPIYIAAGLTILNLWTFMVFGYDKIQAEGNGWRVSENMLLSLALFGGLVGAYAGRAIFRHKTCKQPFVQQLHGIATLHGFAAALAGGWFLG